ncbi:MAG: 3-deoxy-manno-octulosonate cytidylyltransferase [Verrucomicrobia bacterium]|nr:3-deoxy-manno-octulosonate cytidylyltransferase [Verrucomicrobiota bacterium]
MSPRVVGIIPARYGSTRLPGKALKLILGKPMIQRVLERCLTARILDSVWVATDDERIAHAVAAVGGKAIMTSPHHPSGTDRLAEAVTKIAADIVVNLQGDQPFLDAAMIEEAVQPLLDDPALPMATLMHPVVRSEDFANPSVVKVVVDRAGNALYFSRSLIPYPRQIISPSPPSQPPSSPDSARERGVEGGEGQKYVPHRVFEHVGLYVYRRDFLLTLAGLSPTPLEQIESLEQLRVLEHGYKVRVVESRAADHEFTGFSVDTAEDIERAEQMLRERGFT